MKTLTDVARGFVAITDVVPRSAPFASPILMARKPGGGLRFCVDFRKLNSMTKKDRYPLPLISEILNRLSRAKVYTKLDIRQGFHRIRMHPDSEDLTTFRTRYGTYKYKVLPFGVTNGPAAFQGYINKALADYLDDFVTAYVDDVLIFSDDAKEHTKHVRKDLQRLREAGLQAAIHKCEFGVQKTRFLGFIISTTGIEVDPEKVGVILDWKTPTNVRGVQSFLGFCNFYRRFIKDYGRITKPLSRLVKKGVSFVWEASCRTAFNALRKLSLTPLCFSTIAQLLKPSSRLMRQMELSVPSSPRRDLTTSGIPSHTFQRLWTTPNGIRNS